MESNHQKKTSLCAIRKKNDGDQCNYGSGRYITAIKFTQSFSLILFSYIYLELIYLF